MCTTNRRGRPNNKRVEVPEDIIIMRPKPPTIIKTAPSAYGLWVMNVDDSSWDLQLPDSRTKLFCNPFALEVHRLPQRRSAVTLRVWFTIGSEVHREAAFVAILTNPYDHLNLSQTQRRQTLSSPSRIFPQPGGPILGKTRRPDQDKSGPSCIAQAIKSPNGTCPHGTHFFVPLQAPARPPRDISSADYDG